MCVCVCVDLQLLTSLIDLNSDFSSAIQVAILRLKNQICPAVYP